MCNPSGPNRFLLTILLVLVLSPLATAQRGSDNEFGPVMTAYLGYLHNEQEVVDDRASRREISAAYYRRNSNRIHALREMATRIVRESKNDYVPELEAVTGDELRTIFENPPRPSSFRENEVFASKFRFLGAVRSGETFYVFARLDPYEQAEFLRHDKAKSTGEGTAASGQRIGDATSRSRRVAPR